MDVPSLHDHEPLPSSEPDNKELNSNNDEPIETRSSNLPPETSSKDPTNLTDSNQTLPSSSPSPSSPKPGVEDKSQPNTSSSADSISKTDANHPSLEQEITDLKKTLGGVGASLGGWWGKVQKQSVEVLSSSTITAQINTARKDLASMNLLEKAKKEVERLSEQAKEGYSVVSSELEKSFEQPNPDPGRIINVDGVEVPTRHSISKDGGDRDRPTESGTTATSPKGKEREFDQASSSDPHQSTSNDQSPQNFEKGTLTSFLSKLSKDSEKLTTSLQSTLSNLPNAVQVSSPTGRFDLSTVQKAAEGYLAKGEGYLHGVGKELREIVQEAVKVIPPEESDQIDQDPNVGGASSGAGKGSNLTGKSNEPSNQSTLNQNRRLLSNKRDNMIFKLRNDESVIIKDPEVEEKVAFKEFKDLIDEAGGIDSESWKKRAEDEFKLEDSDGVALRATFEKLVPSQMTSQTFWTRYFFAMYRIDQEEAARKAVLSAAQEESEGDFSWDLEDESEPPSSPVVIKSNNSKQQPKKGSTGNDSDGSRSGTPTMKSKAESGGEKISSQLLEKKDSDSTMKGFKSFGSKSDSHKRDEEPEDSPTKKKGLKNKSGNNNNNNGGGRSSSEDGTTDSFDVISAQQSGDESLKEKTKKSETTEEDDDSDWE